jgi:hypothetical protein
MPIAKSLAPATSTRRALAGRVPLGTNKRPPSNTTIPIGTLTKKIERHPKVSTS